MTAVVFGIMAYSVFNIGVALEKKGASQLPKIHHTSFLRNFRNFLTNKIWFSGFLLTCLHWWLLTVALNYGPLSLVSPLRGIGIVVLAVFSRYYLKETIHTPERIGIVLIIIGIITVGATTAEDSVLVSLQDMNELIVREKSLLLFGMLLLSVIIPSTISAKRHFLHADGIFGISAGILLGLGVFFTKAVMTGIDIKAFRETIVICFGSLTWWLYIVGVITFNTLCMIFQQIGFQHGRAIVVVPLATITSIAVPVLMGIVILDEWSSYTSALIAARLVSLLIIGAGITVMSLKVGSRH